MIYVGDQVFMDYMEWDGKEKFKTFLNQTKWSPEKLNQDATVSKQKKFSFRDLVCLSVQKTLKTYGVKEDQFTSLNRSFYQEKQEDTQEDTDSMFTSEVAIGCVFMGIEIILCFMPSGEATFYDPTTFITLRNPVISSFMFISLPSLINDNLIQIKKAPIELKISLQNLIR
jgi:hypothetical protein